MGSQWGLWGGPFARCDYDRKLTPEEATGQTEGTRGFLRMAVTLWWTNIAIENGDL